MSNGRSEGEYGNGRLNPAPAPDLEVLRLRAGIIREIREFFFSRGVLEVETPLLSRGISLDCHIDVFASTYHPSGYPPPAGRTAGEVAGGETFYLQTSPEPHMKRLLCRGFPDIYQIGKAFRNGEHGRSHNPEFTMLEWYRKDFSLTSLMDEVEAICVIAAGTRPIERRSFGDAFRTVMGADPLSLELEQLLTLPLMRERFPGGQGMKDMFPTRADAFDFIMAHIIEPSFPTGSLIFIYDFPADMAAQAQVHRDDPRIAHRFEVYGGGMELGNGYLELADIEEYERRFDGENAKRTARGKPVLPKDSALLAELRRGLPPCAGVAVGLDRLVQLGAGRGEIDSVLAFPWRVC